MRRLQSFFFAIKSLFLMNLSASSRLGLVVEGGGVRAIYAAGVLDVLHDLQLPIEGVIGVSAGAIHGCSFVSGQKGRSYRIYKRFCKDPRFFSLRTLLRTGSIVDNDFCYRVIPAELEPFDEEAFENSGIGFWTVSTNLETGRAEYLRMRNCIQEMPALIASASLPYVSRPIEYQGKKLLDGGCSDRVPIKAFEDMGFARNIVVLTHPEEHHVKDRDAALARIFYRRYPNFCRTFENSPAQYERTQAYIKQQAQAQKAFVIRPAEPIPVGRLSHNPQDIELAYNMGRRDAHALESALVNWLERSALRP